MQELTFIPSEPERLFDVHGLQQVPGGVTCRSALGPWATGPDGRTAPGALGVLADEVSGYALMASLPEGSWSISTEIWIDVVGELPLSGALEACARPVQEGSFAVGRIRDEEGQVVVVCRQRGRAVARPEGLDLATVEAPAGTLRAPDLLSLLGLRAGAGAGVLPASPSLLNPRGMLHGGVSLAASDAMATLSRLDAGSTLPTTSIHIVHTRGIAEGAQLELRATTRHSGRTLWVTDVVGTVDGRTCTVATVTAQP
ncbi:PaaI family thioesterase [Nocardioides sp. J54]|uniref:PaaI family thioesterase n=1 Tax=Nocardioides sp. J54 TaxID=935866 RepID=UPI00048C49EC|nr:hotdog domain-containing protein [Nocardioides sp. J54]